MPPKKDLNKIKFNYTDLAYQNSFYFDQNGDFQFDDKGFDQIDHSCEFSSKDLKINIYFKELQDNVIKKIKAADVVVGCVAWFTSESIINSLSSKSGVSIIIQKEVFLKNRSNKFYSQLRDKYDQLPSFNLIYRKAPKAPLVSSSMLYSGKLFNGLEAVRCMGVSEPGKSSPRMHNKFVVFCRETKAWVSGDYDEVTGMMLSEGYEISELIPYGVWTGSFNFTDNANRSFENAVYIENERIAKQFFSEWGQIATFSEKLDWESSQIDPEAIFE